MTVFDVALFQSEQSRRTLRFGFPLSAVAETGSTNDDALTAARAGAAEGALFVADFQHRGRGRGESRWVAPPAADLTFSLLLRPKLHPQQAPFLTLAVGLAIREVVARRIPAEQVKVKWPNDVWVGERKLAGVLLESVSQAGVLSAVVVGVGLNVKTLSFPEPLSQTAVSLAMLHATASRESLLLDLLESIQQRVDQVIRTGLTGILVELRSHDALRGRRVRVDAAEGIAAGFSADGALIVETDAGPALVRAGHVELCD